MLTKGDKIAHYTIESKLGAGGMGEVYLAKDERLHRNVALKVILERGEIVGSDASPRVVQDASARLVREARAAASLTHPNVVSMFDVGEHEGRVYLAMEYVVGKTLREMMRQNTIGWPKRVRWLTDVARALAAASLADELAGRLSTRIFRRKASLPNACSQASMAAGICSGE